MRPDHYTITPQSIYRYGAAVLEPQLQWPDHGPKCTVATLLQVLFFAAAQLCSIFAACGRLREVPSDQAVRDALIALCPPADLLERQLNGCFARQLPKPLKKRRHRLAIDLTLLPYYGEPQRQTKELYRSQAKRGTTHFHAYASAYLVHRGQRFTVALMRVERGTPLVAVLKQLLRTARSAELWLELLLLDRGFYSVEIIRYLQAARYPFLMPVVRRGRKPSDPRGPSGTYVFAAQRRSGWAHYTLTNAQQQRATVQICIHCCNRHRRPRTLVYPCWGFTPKTTRWVYQTYRLRFGIETSYRPLRQARIQTTTRDPVQRLLFVGIALLLPNLWVWVHWHYLATPRRGGRQLNLHTLPFQTLLCWLAHLVEQTFGINDCIVAER